MMVKVYFGTNRKPNQQNAPDDFSPEFSADGLANLRFGMAEVTGDDLDEYELFLASERLPVDEGNTASGGQAPVLRSENVFQRVRQKIIGHTRDTIIFVHGFNVPFKEALTSAATIKQNFIKDAGVPGVNVVLFS